MTLLERPKVALSPPPVSHAFEIGCAIAGVVSALLGLALRSADSGDVTVVFWEFQRANIAEGWSMGLLAAGCLLLALAFAVFGRKAHQANLAWTPSVALGAALAALAAGGAVTILLIWIL
jgi:hypothetical protein